VYSTHIQAGNIHVMQAIQKQGLRVLHKLQCRRLLQDYFAFSTPRSVCIDDL